MFLNRLLLFIMALCLGSLLVRMHASADTVFTGRPADCFALQNSDTSQRCELA